MTFHLMTEWTSLNLPDIHKPEAFQRMPQLKIMFVIIDVMYYASIITQVKSCVLHIKDTSEIKAIHNYLLRIQKNGDKNWKWTAQQ